MKRCELREYKLIEYVTIAVESPFKQLRSSPKKKKKIFGLLRNCLNCDSTAMVTYSIHSSKQFTSFHSVFHSFQGLMNSVNWPASSVWVFIAQLVEHCSANAEATGSNPVEAPKTFFLG